MKQTIYVIEDDLALQELYAYTLENDFICHCFADGESFFEALPDNVPDLVLLDIMLPGEDGFAILSRLKTAKSTFHIPVIMISAKGEEINKVKGLNLGADDYIAKPFGVLELVARIKANLRKNKKTAGENITYKDIFIDFAKHQIIINDKQISTTLKEYNLLSLLCANAEKVQDRETIFREVWGDNFIGETRTLDIHIKELRRKLAEAASEVMIQTVRGVGYMLI
ncbi:MAG: response regulator transcription factor [Clostridiales bacterium]|nr:response regulator transcription factor [Clostridiales bacterium]MDR2711771.1 response regulator transcription factor [Clostridiales bacterium]